MIDTGLTEVWPSCNAKTNAMLLRMAEIPVQCRVQHRDPTQHFSALEAPLNPLHAGKRNVGGKLQELEMESTKEPSGASCFCSVWLMREAMLLQVAEKESQRKELAQRCEALEVRLAPLDADKAELAGRLQGLEKRAKEAEKARTDFEWRSRCALCWLKPCSTQTPGPVRCGSAKYARLHETVVWSSMSGSSADCPQGAQQCVITDRHQAELLYARY